MTHDDFSDMVDREMEAGEHNAIDRVSDDR